LNAVGLILNDLWRLCYQGLHWPLDAQASVGVCEENANICRTHKGQATKILAAARISYGD
jgi:hypothetical protein